VIKCITSFGDCEFVTILTKIKTKENLIMRNNKKHAKAIYLCYAALIAALYVVLSLISGALGLASGAIQVRISEALCVLPFFMPAAVPGVTIGCLIYNIIGSGNILDIVFGTLATFIGAVGARLLRKCKWAVTLPTIAANTLIIPFVLKYGFMLDDSIWFFFITIFIGEFIAAGILGTVFLISIEKRFGGKKEK
jgi:uncharacterized membrane protein